MRHDVPMKACIMRLSPQHLFTLVLLLASCLVPTAASPLSPLHRHSNVIRPSSKAAVSHVPRGGAKKSSLTIPPSNAPSPIQTFFSTIAQARSHLAAAAVARAVSIFGMYPVDTIKTRMQMGGTRAFSLNGLYKGVWGSMFGNVPYGVLTFGSYEIYKQTLLQKFPTTPAPLIYALSATLGDITGSGWLCPFEVMKQQIQGGMYGGVTDAIKGILSKEGFRGFYRGYSGGLARDVPFRVAQLTTFEAAKNLYLRTKRNNVSSVSKSKLSEEDEVALSPLEAAICGAAAGSFSAAITNPLDRIKTIMMTDTAGVYGGSVAKCAAKIFRDDGLSGLFKGVVPRVGYIAPSVCIFFVTYEMVQQKFKVE